MRWRDVIKAGQHTSVLIPTSKSGKPRGIGCTPDIARLLDQLRKLDCAHHNLVLAVSLTTLKRKLTKLWKESGLNDVRLYDLRRTHASELLRKGVDARTVAGRLAHEDLKMIERHYAPYLGNAHATQAAQEAFSRLF